MTQTGGLALLFAWLLFAVLLVALAVIVLRRRGDALDEPRRLLAEHDRPKSDRPGSAGPGEDQQS
ncbi:MAG TPA: hypothetical protein VJ851_18175 [Jatrophihabitans sp.]|nr:hypothetical protein [Jatrophihabitans sp.]